MKKPMTIKTCIGCLAAWILAFGPSLISAQTLEINPLKPRTGQNISFGIPARSLRHEYKQINLIVFTNISDDPDTLEMTLSEARWTAEITFTDSTVDVVFYTFEGIDGTGKHLPLNPKGRNPLFMHTTEGHPVRSANLHSAMIYNGYGNFQQPNPEAAREAIEQELLLYPDHYQARLFKYTLILSQEGLTGDARFGIGEDIKKTLREQDESTESLRFAARAYEMIEDQDAAEKTLEKLIARDPDGQQAAIGEFNEIMRIDDALELSQQLELFLEEYPDTRLTEIALSQLVSTLIELDDSTAMPDIGDRLLDKAVSMAGASGLSALAGVFSEKKWQLDRANTYIGRALEIMRHIDPADHPPEITDTEWQERIDYTLARYRGIAGWILYQQNEFSRAMALLQTAASGTMEPGILFHLGETCLALNNDEEAIAAYARVAAYGGDMADLAIDRLESIWLRSGRDPDELEAILTSEENELQDAFRDKILKKRNVTPAPDFTMKRLNGGSMKKDDLKGTKTLLLFWATWSDASWQMLEALEEAAFSRDDCQVLAVAVNRSASEVSKYVRDNQIRFQVLLVNQQAEKDYALKGVPVLLVMDTQARIHFRHKGYRPDIARILEIQLDHMD